MEVERRVWRSSLSRGVVVVVRENPTYGGGLSDESDDFHLGPASAGQRVDVIRDGFILHLLQRVRSKSGYLPFDAVSYCGPLELVDRSRADQRATDLGRCTCERG